MTESYFDERRQHSRYHFDATRHDPAGEWFWVFGQFAGQWHQELQELISSSKPINWQTLAGTNDVAMSAERLKRIAKQEIDIVRGGGDPKMTLVHADTDVWRFQVFSKMIDTFGLEQVKARAHVQFTGEVFNYHLDIYPHYSETDQHRLIRIIVNLQDWVPGQFYLYGTHHYSHWQAGDFHTFRWQDVPHATANASSVPRPSLIITGLRTEKTDRLLSAGFSHIIV